MKTTRHALAPVLLLAAVGLSCATPAHAGIIDIPALDSGLYDSTDYKFEDFTGYKVGQYAYDFYETRSFFVFDTAALLAAGPLGQASLVLANPWGGFGSDTVSETLEIRAVDALGTFAALGSGTLFGSYTVTSADDDTLVQIALGTAFLDFVNGGAPSRIILGASLSSLSGDPANDEFVFGGSDGTTVPLLRVATVPDETATLGLCAIAFLGLVLARRRVGPALG